MENNDKDLWRLAKKRASFKKSLTIYFIVNSFLCAIWYVTSGKDGSYFWPVWPILGWGVGIAFQYAEAYLRSDMNAVEREYEKLKKENNTNEF